MFAKLLIANRGEFAFCIARAAGELRIATVAMVSEDDEASAHGRAGDVSHRLSGRGARPSRHRTDAAEETTPCRFGAARGFGMISVVDGGAAASPKVKARAAAMRRMAFIVIMASAFSTGLIYTAVAPILPMLAARFGRESGEQLSQMAMTTPSLGMLLGGLAAGPLLALSGKRALILVTILAMGLLGGAGGLLSDPTLFLTSRLALGVAVVLFATASVTLLADLYEGDARSGALSIVQAISAFGAAPSVLAAGALATRFGWRAPFSLYVVLALPLFLLALLSIQRDRGLAVAAAAAGGQGVGAALRLWPFLLMGLVLNVLLTMGNTQLPFLLKQEGLANPMVMSLILAGNSLAIGSGALLSAPLLKRLGEGKTMLAALIVAGGGILVAGLERSVAVSGASNILSYLGCGVFLPLTYTMVLNRAMPETRGLVIGWIHTAAYIGMFANPLVLAPVRALTGLHGVYVTVGLATIVGAALIGAVIVRRGRSHGAAGAT